MSRLARATAFGLTMLLALGLTLASGEARAYDDKEETKKAQKDILELAKLIEQGKDVSARAAEIKKRYEELLLVMNAYKPSPKGGIGYGKPGAGDGIEMKLLNMGKGRGIAAANLKKEKADLVKMAYINAAIAEIAAHYAPAKPKGGKGAREWKQYSMEQKKAALELIKAVEAGKPDLVRTAVNNLNNACNSCHADFRDS